GGFSINNTNLNRFFLLYFILYFILATLVLIHLIVLYNTIGLSNSLGVLDNYNKLPFTFYFLFKNLVTILLFIFILFIFVFFIRNILDNSENYIIVNLI
ncbi:transmembrane di-heme cytochrome, partial [Lepidopterella palustris CBS 459.81]